ncbi:MAG TPA: dihydrolipoamide acetyltransferase family protein [Solirubrobacterales bacterium]|nr:dihydrolipoamide acetyltransferase family protein [Solirubrobacterales bacterium]
MTELTMPRLSDSMEDGVLLTWLVRPGQEIAEGEELVEIETDKATMVYASPKAGVVVEIVATEGETLAVGEPIARLAAPGAEVAVASTAAVATTKDVSESETAAAQAPTAGPAITADPGPGAAAADGGDAADAAVAATPLARRIAAAHGVALGSLTGSGPRGRVTKADVLAAAGVPPAPAPPRPRATFPAPAAPAADSTAAGDGRIEAPTRLQQTIARRMTEAKSTIPEFQVETEAGMDAAVALRAELKAAAGEAPVPSLNDFVVKACALALREHPKANASFTERGFELHEAINVGVAVAAEGALVVPVVADADRRSLGQIAAETRRLAARVRSGEVTPPELSSGTFTVSNLGMFGMTAITPVINLPQAAIVGVGAIRTVLIRAADGEIVERSLLTLRLSADHRILYGADAARFLAAVRDRLENPLGLLL